MLRQCVTDTSKQAMQLTQVYFKGQEAHCSSQSSIKDLTPYHLCSLGPPGGMKGHMLPEVYDNNLQISARVNL